MGRPRITRVCLQCGVLLRTHQYKFCSNQCQRDKEWNDTKLVIEQTGQFPSSVHGAVPRRYLTEKYGAKCTICGLTHWLNTPILLVLDHIDGNAKNWRLENLRLVCSNCDATLPTYKNRNKGNGRYSRKLRYQNGQSF